MWIVRRRLRRLRNGALVGGAVAACLVVALLFSAIGNSRENSRLKELALAPSHSGAVANPEPDAACAGAFTGRSGHSAHSAQATRRFQADLLEHAEG